MKTTDAIHVLLVEDDADLRGALAEYLALNGCAVTAVGTGMAFYQALSTSETFHVAVIDLGLPDQPGHVLAEYARRNTHMSIIIVTANDGLENRIETYQTGADLFLGKPLDSRELLAAVIAMHRRYLERNGLNQQDTTGNPVNIWRLDRARRLLHTPGGATIILSPQESATCELFNAAATGTVARQQLLTAIYGRDDESAHRALDNMIRRLRQKISEGCGQSAPILTAYGIGYSFSEPMQAH
jgi:DNA-binding response OmpR family regulator